MEDYAKNWTRVSILPDGDDPSNAERIVIAPQNPEEAVETKRNQIESIIVRIRKQRDVIKARPKPTLDVPSEETWKLFAQAVDKDEKAPNNIVIVDDKNQANSLVTQ